MSEEVFSGSVIINRHILEVFNYVADVESTNEWNPFFRQLKKVDGRFRATLSASELLEKLLHRDLSFFVDVTDIVPGRRLSYRSADIGLITTMEFEPSLQGTLVKATQSLWGWQATVFGLFTQPSRLSRLLMNDWIMRSLLSLKRNAEARVVDVNPIFFFNYRRSQATYVGGRIYDALVQEFGAGYVFRDFESLVVGRQWQEGINKALSGCKAVIAHIGDQWEEEIEIKRKKKETDWVAKRQRSD